MVAATKPVRVRIAPSPTGDPHVGLAYVTLFNYIFAKQHGGSLVLRIEDTDQLRAKASSEEMIMTSLRWLGLQWDEGPDVGGPHGPYRQSERKHLYLPHALSLVENTSAYYCFCTSERLDELRAEQKAKGIKMGYDGHCRHLAKDEVQAKLARKEPHVIRLKMPTTGMTVVHDELRGAIEFHNEQLDDQVLIKSDGFPTYHLANVVDDHLMEITHVMRAEEWISSTPKHVILYEAFGWEKPKFIHLPLLRNMDRSKISKRKNPVSLNYYRRKGILPKAMVNFLSLMGWSFGNDVEIFTVEEMAQKFRLEDIHLGGPVFDLTKLTWLNQHYLQKLGPEAFAQHLREEVFSEDLLKALQPLFMDRLGCFEQFVDKANFFFNGALSYEGLELVPKGKTSEDIHQMLSVLLEELDDLYVWKKPEIEALLANIMARLGWKAKDFYMPIRLVVSGRKDSPPLMECIEIVGREMVRFRIRQAMDFVKVAG